MQDERLKCCQPRKAQWLVAVKLMLICWLDCLQALFVVMTSEGHVYLLDHGSQLTLECNFHADDYDLFQYPVTWKKQQLNEECQLNVMSSINEPFLASSRFDVHFSSSQASRFRFILIISDIQASDSANYTCEVRSPGAEVLGSVTHQVYVKAPISSINLTVTSPNGTRSFLNDLDTTGSREPLTLYEEHPTSFSCLAKGGYPPADVAIKINHSRLLQPANTQIKRSQSLTGDICLRVIKLTSEVRVHKFLPSFKDDESLIGCSAQVPGLEAEAYYFMSSVKYSPKITCHSTGGYVGERSAQLTCEVLANPRLLDCYWVIDHINYTVLREGREVNEYRLVPGEKHKHRQDVHLLLRKVKTDSFKSYTLVVKNAISMATKSVEFYQKFKPTTEQPQSDDRSRFSNVQLGYQGHQRQLTVRSWSGECGTGRTLLASLINTGLWTSLTSPLYYCFFLLLPITASVASSLWMSHCHSRSPAGAILFVSVLVNVVLLR